jgi:hypothetical protein
MFIPSYLLMFLFVAYGACPYTVVLTSGKTIRGTFVSEQQDTIVIKDTHGVLISFKKNKLDLQAMSVTNQSDRAVNSHNGASKRKSPPSIVDLAAETRRRRTGNAKTVNLDHLDQNANVSVFGSEKPEHSSTSTIGKRTVEQEWQSRLWTMKKEVNRLREKVIVADAACEESREKQYAARTTPSRKPVELMSTYKETPQCRKSSELTKQLQEAESRLDSAREEARRAGVPWQTLE